MNLSIGHVAPRPEIRREMERSRDTVRRLKGRVRVVDRRLTKLALTLLVVELGCAALGIVANASLAILVGVLVLGIIVACMAVNLSYRHRWTPDITHHQQLVEDFRQQLYPGIKPVLSRARLRQRPKLSWPPVRRRWKGIVVATFVLLRL